MIKEFEWLNYMESICKEFLSRKEMYMQFNFTSEQAVETLKEIDTIKNYILKAQEQDKVLKIISNKGLPVAEIKMIKQSENYEKYNIEYSWVNWKNASISKNEEEFNLLKRYLCQNE